MGYESHHHAAVRHRRHCRIGQGLPALRQVQAGVQHARAAAPTCCTRRATRFWPPRCWSKPSCTRSRRAGASASHHWQEFEDVAEHCTVCHKCFTPCPVKIDFGDVSMNMRNLLRKMDKKSFNPGNKLAMTMLNATEPTNHQAAAQRHGGRGLQGAARWRSTCSRPWPSKQISAPAGHRGHSASIKEQVIHFVNKKLPGGLPTKTARALLDIEDKDYVPIIRNPQTTTADTEAVFYFPGCGSERLFSQVGLATQAMLLARRRADGAAAGLSCCGYPQRGSGQFRHGREDDHRQPRAVPPRVHHAQLPGHQDRGGELRHLLRPAGRATSSTRSSPAAASWTSTNTCWKKASPCRRARAATCTTSPATTP